MDHDKIRGAIEGRRGRSIEISDRHIYFQLPADRGVLSVAVAIKKKLRILTGRSLTMQHARADGVVLFRVILGPP